MGFRAGLALAAVGNALLIVALFFNIFFLFFTQPGAGVGVFVGVAFFAVAAPIWFIGVILLLVGFFASRGVRSKAIGSLFALAAVIHLLFVAMLLAAAGGSPRGPVGESATLLVPPVVIAALLGLVAARRF